MAARMRSVSTTTMSPVGRVLNVGLGTSFTAVLVGVLATVGALGTSSVFTAMAWPCPDCWAVWDIVGTTGVMLCSTQACQIKTSTSAKPVNRMSLWKSTFSASVVQTTGVACVLARHHVHTTWVPGVAADQPTQCQPDAAGYAVTLDCLYGVGRTRGIETASRPQ